MRRAEQAAGDFADAPACQSLCSSVCSRTGTRSSATRPTRLRVRLAGVVQLRQHLVSARKTAGTFAAACGALSGSPSSGWPRPGWWWCRCRCRRGTGRLPAAASCARPGRSGLTSGWASRARASVSACAAGHGNFKTVFAGVAAAGEETVAAGDAKTPAGHEHQFFHAGRQARQRGHGLRALQRQQRHLGHGNHLAAAADFLLDVRDVADLAGAVDDDENVVPRG